MSMLARGRRTRMVMLHDLVMLTTVKRRRSSRCPMNEAATSDGRTAVMRLPEPHGHERHRTRLSRDDRRRLRTAALVNMRMHMHDDVLLARCKASDQDARPCIVPQHCAVAFPSSDRPGLRMNCLLPQTAPNRDVAAIVDHPGRVADRVAIRMSYDLISADARIRCSNVSLRSCFVRLRQ